MNAEAVNKVRQIVEERDINGYFKFRLCADIVAFVPGTFQENSKGLLHFYERALEQIQDHIKYYLLDGEGRFKKIKRGIVEAFLDWAKNLVADRNVYGLDLESGTAPDEQSDHAFQMHFSGGGAGFVRLVMPAESLLNAEAFVELARNCLTELRFASAYAGFAVNARRTYDTTQAGGKVAMISRRFPGIDLDSPLMFASFLENSIKSVNWLTGLGTSLLAENPSVQGKLPSSAKVFQLKHGILIQSTKEAQIGDANRNDHLPDYAAVGKVLAPLQIPDEKLGPYDGVGGTENTRDWLARFS